MDYEESIGFLYSLGRLGEKEIRLDRMRALMQRIGNPHRKMKSILVTGTNGKGSTVAMLSSILKEARYKTGMFISPHLSSFTERISINKKKIPEQEVVRQIQELKPIVAEMERDPTVFRPSFFEATTAIMFKYFAENNVEFAVLEVGLGGRLDATNVVNALVSIITNIHLEHTDILGETVSEIAQEKAGIIKHGGILITGEEKKEALTIFEKKCQRKNSAFYRVGKEITVKSEEATPTGQWINVTSFDKTFHRLKLPLIGSHQTKNAALAVGTIQAIRTYGIPITDEAIRRGLEKTRWPGRLERVNKKPAVLLDCAKDPAATKTLKENVEKIFDYDEVILVTSISSDKDIPTMMGTFTNLADTIIITEHTVMERATEPKVLVKEVEKYGKPYVIIRDVKKAVKKAMSLAGEKSLVLVTGSVFTVGKARELWFDEVRY